MEYVLWIGLVFSLLMALTGSSPLWPCVLFTGIAANGLVMGLNEWKMPVRGLHVEGVRHTPMVPATRLKCLADVIPTGLGIASIGDVLIAAGVLGVWANRGHIAYVEVIALSAFGLWVVGWSRGFNLLTKWTKEERRDARKNVPIAVALMIIGNLLGVRGCGMSDLTAAAKIETGDHSVEVKTEQPHSLGELVNPPFNVMTRLRMDAAKRERERKEDQAKAVKIVQQLVETNFPTFSPGLLSPKSARKGPFCRVTCAAHHGGEYDVETMPEMCRANVIPASAQWVPGWVEIGSKQEETRPWPGPASVGFEKYTLYWSDRQSEAKIVHPSISAIVATTTSKP